MTKLDDGVSKAVSASGVEKHNALVQRVRSAQMMLHGASTQDANLKNILDKMKSELSLIRSLKVSNSSPESSIEEDASNSTLRFVLAAQSRNDIFLIFRAISSLLFERAKQQDPKFSKLEYSDFINSIQFPTQSDRRTQKASAADFDAVIQEVLFSDRVEAAPSFKIPAEIHDSVEPSALASFDPGRFLNEDGTYDNEAALKALHKLPKKSKVLNDPQLTALLVMYYPNHVEHAWKAYADELNNALNNRRDELPLVLAKVVNSSFSVLSKDSKYKQRADESRRDFAERVRDKIAHDLSKTLVYYLNIREGGDTRLASPLIAALRSIPTDRLHKELSGVDFMGVAERIGKAEVSPSRSRELEEELSRVAIGSNKTVARIAVTTNSRAKTLGIGFSGDTTGVGRLLRIGGRTASDAGKSGDKKILEPDQRFAELYSVYGLRFADLEAQLVSSLDQAVESNSDNLAQYFNKSIYENFDLAYERQEEKKSADCPAELGIYKDLDEMKELLKLFAFVSNSKELRDKFSKLHISVLPSQLFLSQIIDRYFSRHLAQNEDRERIVNAFNQCVSSLENEYAEFEGLRNLYEDANRQRQTKQEEVTMDAAEQGVNTLINERNQARNKIRKFGLKKTDEAQRDLGCRFDSSNWTVNAQSFLSRLNDRNYLNDDLKQVVDASVSEAKSEMIYLLTGLVILSPYDSAKADRVYVVDKNDVRVMTKAQIEEVYDKALPKLKSVFHADAVEHGALSGLKGLNISDPKTLGKTSFTLLSDFTDFIKTGAGWQRGKFSSRLQEVLDLCNSPDFQGETIKVPGLLGDSDSSEMQGQIDELQKKVGTLVELARLFADSLEAKKKSKAEKLLESFGGGKA